MNPTRPLVIVGAGPAGLAAAHAYRGSGREPLVIDAGSAVAHRRRDDPRDVIRGVGGAGLYSDGKFSFFPSATRLWSLGDQPLLRASYAWVRGLLSGFGLDAPAFPAGGAPALDSGFKPYPSLTLDLGARVRLIERLAAPLADRLALRTRLVGVGFDGDRFTLRVETSEGEQTIHARELIGAGGRFFPLLLQREGLIPRSFMRVELGVRIEGAAAHPFFGELSRAGRSRDPKLIVSDSGGRVQWRTFCFCADGEVVRSLHDGLHTYSGRSDCPPTGRSNVGFNVRFLEPGDERSVLERLRRRGPFRLTLDEVLAGPRSLEGAFGERVAHAFHDGLRELRARLPALGAEGLTVVGPTVEGVGEYPATDENLRCPSLPLHFAGDTAGTFRGLVAALVSGAFVGARVARADLMVGAL